MQLVEGVLLVLDPAGTPFTRIWCCFEESMCMLQKDADGIRRKLKLDIATIHAGKPCLIAEGLPGIEASQNFPLQLLERGFVIDIAKGEATQAADKQHILNSIAGKEGCELDTTEPPTEHPTFDEVNKLLANMFAEAAMPPSMLSQRCTGVAICMALLSEAKHSKLELNFCRRCDENLVSVWDSLKVHAGPELHHLALDFSNSKRLSDVSALGQSLGSLSTLQHLALIFRGCSKLSDVSALGQSLGSLLTLQHLVLNFTKCRQVSDVSVLGQSLGSLATLQHLDLKFCECSQLSDVSVLGQSLGSLSALQHLDLDFSWCPQLPAQLRHRFTSCEEFIQRAGPGLHWLRFKGVYTACRLIG